MNIQTKLVFALLLFSSMLTSNLACAENTGKFVYQHEGMSYPYAITQTGDNYTYEFEKSPGVEGKKLKAILQVLLAVYEDGSINPSYSETFMKETALCFVFDGNFYSYRACFLPNDYSPNNRDRFWGFVTKLPNARWLITFNLLPLLLVIGLVFYYPKIRNLINSSH